MKEVALKENLIMYQFEADDKKILGQNIFVLFSDDECIVFDAGYERHMEQVLKHLTNHTIKHVICTHFHPDHVYGLNVLPKQSVIGSKYALETLTMFEDESNELLLPDIIVNDTYQLEFDNHIITLTICPGHSNCGMLIDIDGEFLLVGDDYMSTNDNIPVLPYIAESIKQHIESLQFIVNHYNGYTFLPSHGVKTKNIDDLNFRIRYLLFTLTREVDITKLYNKNDVHFKNENWHKLNVKKK